MCDGNTFGEAEKVLGAVAAAAVGTASAHIVRLEYE
ncbi:hypothetical protein PC123_g18101 [Phytophthora cactorum]|nr:hypothetical protein PC123_g18101 [Phytophthora cactorum]